MFREMYNRKFLVLVEKKLTIQKKLSTWNRGFSRWWLMYKFSCTSVKNTDEFMTGVERFRINNVDCFVIHIFIFYTEVVMSFVNIKFQYPLTFINLYKDNKYINKCSSLTKNFETVNISIFVTSLLTLCPLH